MSTRETRKQRGQRNAEQILRKLAVEIRQDRQIAGLSQRALAAQVGMSQGELSRFERFEFPRIALGRVSELAAVLGLELSAGLRRNGDPVRDAGHQATIARFLGTVNSGYRCTREVPLPAVGDRRSWDILMRLGSLLIGVEVETRIRDIQALVRRVRERERDGGVDVILLVLADSVHNRALVSQLRDALGPRFASNSRSVMSALRSGQRVPGSAVVVI